MIAENIYGLKQEIGLNTKLVIVSKFRTIEEIREAYYTGHRCFAENRVQALLERREQLPHDIEWHLIGHLQSNKIKYITPFINCIQSIDSLKLLELVQESALKNDRKINCLLQMYIAREETKFGLSEEECLSVLNEYGTGRFSHIVIKGLMAMASNTNDQEQIRKEFEGLKKFYDSIKDQYGFDTLSMGMSSDYRLAVDCGSNMVRVGSKVFEK